MQKVRQIELRVSPHQQIAQIHRRDEAEGYYYESFEIGLFLHCARFYEKMSSDDALKKAKSFYQKARDQYMIIEGNNDLDVEEM